MPDLPVGTVTFLLTDIEGSTRLWEAHGQAMAAAVARHDALLSGVVAGHGGVLIKTRGAGDSAFAVFARATCSPRPSRPSSGGWPCSWAAARWRRRTRTPTLRRPACG